MKASYIDSTGGVQQVEITADMLLDKPREAGLSPTAYINRTFADANLKVGTAMEQFRSSLGIYAQGNKDFGFTDLTLGQIEANLNVSKGTGTMGTESRAFVVQTILDATESKMLKDMTSDTSAFDGMVGMSMSIATEVFEQPVIDYTKTEAGKAQRMAQNAPPPLLISFSTSDVVRKLPVWNMGMQWSDQALRATTLDFVTMSVARYLMIERDERVNTYLSEVFLGGGDLNKTTVATVASSALDATSIGGVLTHKAWVKFLARNRKYRKITHVACTVGTYLQIEGRTGRPGTVNYDPRMAGAIAGGQNAMPINVSFGEDVKVFLVDDAADNGPIPEGQVWALDARSALTRVTNTGASYSAMEEYAMKRSSMMRFDWSEGIFRTYGDVDLKPFDRLVITP